MLLEENKKQTPFSLHYLSLCKSAHLEEWIILCAGDSTVLLKWQQRKNVFLVFCSLCTRSHNTIWGCFVLCCDFAAHNMTMLQCFIVSKQIFPIVRKCPWYSGSFTLNLVSNEQLCSLASQIWVIWQFLVSCFFLASAEDSSWLQLISGLFFSQVNKRTTSRNPLEFLSTVWGELKSSFCVKRWDVGTV